MNIKIYIGYRNFYCLTFEVFEKPVKNERFTSTLSFHFYQFELMNCTMERLFLTVQNFIQSSAH